MFSDAISNANLAGVGLGSARGQGGSGHIPWLHFGFSPFGRFSQRWQAEQCCHAAECPLRGADPAVGGKLMEGQGWRDKMQSCFLAWESILDKDLCGQEQGWELAGGRDVPVF